MPVDALPVPPARPVDGAVQLRREYRDALGRPMTGSVRISGAERAQLGERVVMPAPVTADVPAGVLDVALPPGRYTLAASLATVDGHRADDTTTVVLPPTDQQGLTR